MSIETDGKDFTVQFSDPNTDEWKSAGVFADEHSAKQHAMHLLHSRQGAAVRVVQTRYCGWRNPDGTFQWVDDIGERDDKDGQHSD